MFNLWSSHKKIQVWWCVFVIPGVGVGGCLFWWRFVLSLGRSPRETLCSVWDSQQAPADRFNRDNPFSVWCVFPCSWFDDVTFLPLFLSSGSFTGGDTLLCLGLHQELQLDVFKGILSTYMLAIFSCRVWQCFALSLEDNLSTTCYLSIHVGLLYT